VSQTRYLARYGRFGVQIRPQIQEAYATGAVRVLQSELSAYFQPYLLTPLERELAINEWTWNGSYQELDEATTVEPDYRIGLYDSEQHQADAGFSDEVREEIEEFLNRYAESFDAVVAVGSFVQPPWPRYDEFRGTPAALVRRLVDDGHDLELVLAYEREHQRRPKVVEEIEKAIESGKAPTDDLEETVVG
jgi:hypothetical protein